MRPKKWLLQDLSLLRHEIDLFLNIALLGGCWYWMMSWAEDKNVSPYWLYVVVFNWVVIFIGGLFLLLLGPVVWFTVRVR